MNVLRHIGSRTFQSTLPLRGATPSNAVNNASSDFNPHSPCGERQPDHETDVDEDEFQSTLPVRGATRALSNPLRFRVFQSTLPLRGATWFPTFHPSRRNFNPHSPCGERRTVEPQYKFSFLFQSTLPLRGATVPPRHAWRDGNISIHTPLAGSDKSRFNHGIITSISIHTPLAGSDYYPVSQTECAPISIHTPLAGSDFATPQVIAALNVISIHTPLAGSDV